jgi:hypothetical protein
MMGQQAIHQVPQCSILFPGLALSMRSYFLRELENTELFPGGLRIRRPKSLK